jgi:long-chain acyl-CoA synthetase
MESPFWDKLVFQGLRAKLGLDCVRFLATGSAPIAPHVMNFFRVAMGCPMFEGYGATETAALLTLSLYEQQHTTSHVGGPMPTTEVKLASVPDMGYLATDEWHGRVLDDAGHVVTAGVPCRGRGEIVGRGPVLFKGYYKAPQKTKEVIDEDGWYHTGDVGIWTAEGNLKIVDRKKNIFKLSQGEYIAPEKIENVYAASEYVASIFVYGDSLQSCLVGLVVVDPDRMLVLAKEKGWTDELETLCKQDDVKKIIMDDLVRLGKEHELRGFEKVKALHLDPEPWTPDTILTPTMKLKRADAKKMYLPVIESMYDHLGGVAGMTGVKQE